jgi:hypothetical protein
MILISKIRKNSTLEFSIVIAENNAKLFEKVFLNTLQQTFYKYPFFFFLKTLQDGTPPLLTRSKLIDHSIINLVYTEQGLLYRIQVAKQYKTGQFVSQVYSLLCLIDASGIYQVNAESYQIISGKG